MKYYIGDEQQKFLDTNPDTVNRVAFVEIMTSIIHSNIKHKGSFVHTVAKEHLWTDFLALFYPKNFYLIETIDKKLNAFLSSGIINYFVDRYVDMLHWHIKVLDTGPQTLTLEHLRGAFNLWLAILLIAAIVFFIEISLQAFKSKRILKIKKTFKLVRK